MTNTLNKIMHNGDEYDFPTYTAGANITISDNEISATDTTYTAGTGIDITGTTISNDGVTSVNGGTGDVTVEEGITKIFTLADTSDTATAQEAYDWWLGGGLPVVILSGKIYNISTDDGSTQVEFSNAISYGSTRIIGRRITFTISDGVVTTITQTSVSISNA